MGYIHVKKLEVFGTINVLFGKCHPLVAGKTQHFMYNAASLKDSQFSTYRNTKYCFSEWKESDNIPFETV